MSNTTDSNAKETFITTSCGYDCGGRCLLKVHLRGAKVHHISTDKHKGLDIRACPRGLAQNAVVNDPHRLMQPMRRIGPRGDGQFETISWDEALQTIASQLQRVKAHDGTESIFFVSNSGSISTLHNTPRVTQRFFSGLGSCTTTWGVTSFQAASQSSRATFGTIFTDSTRDNLLFSKLIMLWGWNPVVTRFGPDTASYLTKAKKAGVKIICVDPRHNPSSQALADQWISIKPGTDAAMLIAMAHVIITEALHDTDYIEKYTAGFDPFDAYVTGKEDGVPKTPAWAQTITGVPAETIVKLARDYAGAKPAALITGWAPGRSAYGEQFHRAASTLAAITANIGIEGGHASGGVGFVDLGLIKGKVPVPRIKHQRVHTTELYDTIIHGKSAGYHADCKLLYIAGANLLNQFLNLNKGKEALSKPEFIVVHDLFLTPTAKFADIVLPVSHFLERSDIGQPYVGGRYCIYMNKIIDPADGPKSDLQIFSELAARLGIEADEKSDEEWLKVFLEAEPDFPDLQTLMRKGVHLFESDRPVVAFREQIENPEQHPFPTPSGKIEIYSQMFAEMNNPLIPAIPKYIEPWEGPADQLAQEYPIQLVSPHSKARANSQFNTIASLKKLADDALWINTDDARRRDIKDGDRVVVFNHRGRLYTTAKVTDHIMPGVASLDQGQWYQPDDQGVDHGACANILTRDKMSPAGGFACNSVLVQINKS